MAKRWIEVPDVELPPIDVDEPPFTLIRINAQWKRALLSLVQHADQTRFWAGNPNQDDVEQNAYKLYQAIRNGAGMIGAVVPYASDEPPIGTLLCNGAIHWRSDYPRLYEVLPASLIVSADTFRTPDLSGLFVLGADATRPPFTTGGESEHVLTSAEMPSHTHAANPHDHQSPPHAHTYNQPTFGVDIESVGVPDPTGVGNPPITFPTSAASVTIAPATVEILSAGDGQAHNNMPPFIALRYAIVAE